MKVAKIRMADDTMAVYDITGQRPKSADAVIKNGRLIATRVRDVWRKAAHGRDIDPILTKGASALEALPIAFDRAPGKVFAYVPVEHASGRCFVWSEISRNARSKLSAAPRQRIAA